MYSSKSKNQEIIAENPFNMSLGDLMAGLLLIFILLLSFALLRLEGLISENKSRINIMDEQKRIKEILIKRLLEELAKDEVEVDRQTGVIRITEGILFEFGSYLLKPEGKSFLRRIIPKYSKILLSEESIRFQIAQIIIEGHTDNIGGYEYNLNLSLQRAKSVAEYIFSQDFGNFQYHELFIQLLSVNGRSFMEPRATNFTSEGRACNRRVELKFRLKDWDMMTTMSKEIDSENQK